ncbi:UNKNOWN [Stylonychia lemnae]|uniref:Uncharacterized protein n=1 Tax=Stylonychia lemnae TaxID=5949 RepID=A0A077ZXT5_STYLE|nr:UNKNOWN [Stylonychia lemnae]|eukprot:CDW74715.1 UNKNOWN [Stylonychia lemnae]
MFPRISKFSNVSTTSSNINSNSTASGNTQQRRNDSSNIRNLLFGGYEEPVSQGMVQATPQQLNNKITNESTSTIDHTPTTKQNNQSHIDIKQNQALQNMEMIENKLNSKLEEIEKMFVDRQGSAKISSPLVQGGLYQIENQNVTLDQFDEVAEQSKVQQKGGKKEEKKVPAKRQASANNRKVALPDKKPPQRQPSLNQQQRAQQFLEQQMQSKSKANFNPQKQIEPDQNIIKNARATGMINQDLTQNKLPPRNGPVKAKEQFMTNLISNNIEDSQQLSEISMHDQRTPQQIKQINTQTSKKEIKTIQPQQSANNVEFENLIEQMDRQLQLKTTENTKLKKKITSLEKQIVALKQENDKQIALQTALTKDGGPIENTDERRIMILKAQNGQLTKHNAYLTETLKNQKKIMIEVDHILTDLTTMCKSLDLAKQLAQGMKKRLKSTSQVEQKDFNARRFEQDNPFYITKQDTQFANKYEADDENGQQNVIFTEQKLALLLENSIDLYQRCFLKNKVPNSNQFLRFCEDLRQSVESLLLLGIAINPDDSQEVSLADRSKHQALRDYVERKLITKIHLDKHVLITKSHPKTCKIMNRELVDHLNDVAFWNNSKKSEKQQELQRFVSKVQQGELGYLIEIYLKQQQINILKAQFGKIFNHLNILKQWFRKHVTSVIIEDVRFNVYEKFQDLENIYREADEENLQASQVKLWSVFNLHYSDMMKGLRRVVNIDENQITGGFNYREQEEGEIDIKTSDGYIEKLSRAFEQRFDEAKEIIMNWTEISKTQKF